MQLLGHTKFGGVNPLMAQILRTPVRVLNRDIQMLQSQKGPASVSLTLLIYTPKNPFQRSRNRARVK